MQKAIIFIFLFFFIVNAFAQNANSIWCFGDSAGIDFNNAGNPIPIMSSVVSRGSCASISDSSGQVLFYANNRTGNLTESTRVWNRNGQIMQNGDSIKGEGAYQELTIIPLKNNLYYLFITCCVYPGNEGFYYCMIDMTQNSGLGAVVQKNIQLDNQRTADCVKAIKHGNGRDWWVITKLSTTTFTQLNRFYVYLIDSSGISNPIIQDMGNSTDQDLQRIIFNSDGTKFMQINTSGFMCEYSFNRCTGIISNPNVIFTEQSSSNNRIFWEGAYSPDDTKFYASMEYCGVLSDTSMVIQYDLAAPNIPLSADTLFKIKAPVYGGAVRLAPDNKIYYTCWYFWGFPGYPYPDSVYNQYNMNLGVVNNPDSDGIACDFQPFSFYLGGKRTYMGLPNNPDYSLGPLNGSICDTLFTGIRTSDLPEVETYPNPFTNELVIAVNSGMQKNTLVEVYNSIGEKVYSKVSGADPLRLNTSNWPAGIYIVRLSGEVKAGRNITVCKVN